MPGEELPGAGPRRRTRRGRYIGDVGAGDGAARRAVQGRPGVGEDGTITPVTDVLDPNAAMPTVIGHRRPDRTMVNEER